MLNAEMTAITGIVITGTMALIGLIGFLLFYKYGTLTGMVISFVFLIASCIMLAICLQEKSTIDKNKKFHLYELKLSDGTIVTDSLYSEKEYFYNKKGTEYYKINIIYSKKLN